MTMTENKPLSRHESRRVVFTLLFAWEFHKEEKAIDFYYANKEGAEVAYKDYIRDTFLGTAEHLSEIDSSIEQYAVKWKVSRMARVTRSLLRLAVYEILYTETPARAVINEIVEFAKEYDDASSPAFINGILNTLARDNGKIVSEPKADGTEDIPNAADPEKEGAEA